MLEDCESLTDSVTSTDVEDSDVVSDSDFDLSDPEVLAETSTGADVAIINEIQETNEFDFVSGNSAVLGFLFNSESAVSVDNEDYSSASGASFVRRLSRSGRRARGRSRGYRPRTPQRGKSDNVQSTGRGRVQSCAKSGVQSHRRSRGARNRGGRGRGQSFREQRRKSDEPPRLPLNIECILTKTDVVKATFLLTPSTQPGFYLPVDIETSDPESLFKLFFSQDIAEYICKASDEYADLLRDRRKVMYEYYKRMAVEDFYKMVALLIHFGYKKIPNYRLAWSKKSLCYDRFVSNTMSRNRFESLMYFLHIVTSEDEEKFKNDNDKLAKVRPLSDHLNKKCKLYCQPEKELSVDERMVRSKARFSFKQYIRNKPTKWGFKLWCLCNSSNGFTIKFSVYRGKSGDASSKKGLSYDVVLYLMKDYLDQGRALYVDNFYTSPTLAIDLFGKKTHVTGTLDKTRIGVPEEVHTMLETL